MPPKSKKASANEKSKLGREQVEEAAMFIEKNLTYYLDEMDKIQRKVYEILTSEKKANITSLNDLTLYIKASAAISNFWITSSGYSKFNKAVEFYFATFYPMAIASPKTVFLRNECIKFGNIITGIAVVEGDYYLGLKTLITLANVNPDDPNNYAFLLKYSCYLKEWEVFNHYYDKLGNRRNLFNGLSEACYLSFRFYNAPSDDDKRAIFQEVADFKHKLENSGSMSYYMVFALQITYDVISSAANLENYDINTFMDSIDASRHLMSKSFAVLANKKVPIYEANEPAYFYISKEVLSDSSNFAKKAISLAEFYEADMKYIFYMHQCAIVRDCEQQLVLLLPNAIKLVSPYRILTTLTEFYYLKSKTTSDRVKLKGLAASISLLLSKYSNNESDKQHRKNLLSKNYLVEKPSDTESFIDNTVQRHDIIVIPHTKACNCWLCDFKTKNGVFKILQAWAEYLLDSNPKNYDKLSDELVYANTIIERRNLAIEMIPNATISKGFYPQISCYYYCLASLYHLMEYKAEITEETYKETCGWVIKASSLFLEYRGFYLLAKQLLRLSPKKCSYPWIDDPSSLSSILKNVDMKSITNSFQSLAIKKKSTVNKGNRRITNVFRDRDSIIPHHNCQELAVGAKKLSDEYVLKARTEFKAYNHLMYSDWRSRICLYLGAAIAESYPWYAALYFIESQAIGLRQCVRVRKTDSMDMRFRNVEELKEFICNLPEDLCIIHLLLDEQNILWLIRIDCDSRPVVIPLKKLEESNEILKEMEEILKANDGCVKTKPKSPSEFWKNRLKVDKMLGELVHKMESDWISRFKPLLVPSGKFNSEMLNYLNIFCGELMDAGYCEDHAKLLARVYLHAEEEDFQWLLNAFGKMQIKRQELSNEEFQIMLYDKLKDIPISTKVLNEYANSEKYTALIVPPSLASLPWEFLPLYEKSPYVLRTQSLNMLKRSMKKFAFPHIVNPKKSYYLLNPGNDLPETEQRMDRKLDLSLLEGMKRNCPSKKEFQDMLSTKDLFLYIGHGSGARHFGNSAVRDGQCRASAILMGCSSVRLTDEGRGYDGACTAHYYAIANSPCVIGCLWMVTDGEIDKFFISLIASCYEELLKEKHEIDDTNKVNTRMLMRAMVKARSACRLKYLTGGAVVAYGVPVLSAINNDYADSR